MALTADQLAKARAVAAALPPLTERQRDELALLLRPWVLEAQARSRNPRPPRRAPGSSNTAT